MFLKVGVTRKAYSELYIEVPDGFDKNKLRSYELSKELGKVAKETTDSCDWENYGWEDDLDVDDINEVSVEEANLYKVGKLHR